MSITRGASAVLGRCAGAAGAAAEAPVAARTAVAAAGGWPAGPRLQPATVIGGGGTVATLLLPAWQMRSQAAGAQRVGLVDHLAVAVVDFLDEVRRRPGSRRWRTRHRRGPCSAAIPTRVPRAMDRLSRHRLQVECRIAAMYWRANCRPSASSRRTETRFLRFDQRRAQADRAVELAVVVGRRPLPLGLAGSGNTTGASLMMLAGVKPRSNAAE